MQKCQDVSTTVSDTARNSKAVIWKFRDNL